MNMKTMKQIAENPKEQWYYNQKEIAVMFGFTRQKVGEFLIKYSVPYYRIGKEKSYFLSDVIEAIEKTRWKN